jgi:hypothetical protein
MFSIKNLRNLAFANRFLRFTSKNVFGAEMHFCVHFPKENVQHVNLKVAKAWVEACFL